MAKFFLLGKKYFLPNLAFFATCCNFFGKFSFRNSDFAEKSDEVWYSFCEFVYIFADILKKFPFLHEMSIKFHKNRFEIRKNTSFSKISYFFLKKCKNGVFYGTFFARQNLNKRGHRIEARSSTLQRAAARI